jgi:undecaprenyl diphosphate synthase
MFLDNTVNEIYEIEHGKTTRYVGNYSQFVTQKKIQRAQQAKEFESQQAEIARIQATADRFRYKATKAAMAQSKLKAIERMEKDKVKMEFFGDVSVLSPKLLGLIERTREISKHYDGCQVNICLNYGGRDEIIRGIMQFAEEYKQGSVTELTEETFNRYLFSSGVPDPDLLIRPGGELRLSNFLMWQSAYSELYFTDTLWPDMNAEEIDKAIDEFYSRKRRFGGLNKNTEKKD